MGSPERGMNKVISMRGRGRIKHVCIHHRCGGNEPWTSYTILVRHNLLRIRAIFIWNVPLSPYACERLFSKGRWPMLHESYL